MHQAVVHGFLVRIQPGSYLGGGFRGGAKGRPYFPQQGQEGPRGLFAGLHAGLVVGVDVHEGGIEGDGALKQGDQLAERFISRCSSSSTIR